VLDEDSREDRNASRGTRTLSGLSDQASSGVPRRAVASRLGKVLVNATNPE
jgi:hypothetical protein